MLLETDVSSEVYPQLSRFLCSMRKGAQALTYLDLQKMWGNLPFPFRQVGMTGVPGYPSPGGRSRQVTALSVVVVVVVVDFRGRFHSLGSLILWMEVLDSRLSQCRWRGMKLG